MSIVAYRPLNFSLSVCCWMLLAISCILGTLAWCCKQTRHFLYSENSGTLKKGIAADRSIGGQLLLSICYVSLCLPASHYPKSAPPRCVQTAMWILKSYQVSKISVQWDDCPDQAYPVAARPTNLPALHHRPHTCCFANVPFATISILVCLKLSLTVRFCAPQ